MSGTFYPPSARQRTFRRFTDAHAAPVGAPPAAPVVEPEEPVVAAPEPVTPEPEPVVAEPVAPPEPVTEEVPVVDPEETPVTEPEKAAPEWSASMKKADLLAVAAKLNVAVEENWTKAQILDALASAAQ